MVDLSKSLPVIAESAADQQKFKLSVVFEPF